MILDEFQRYKDLLQPDPRGLRRRCWRNASVEPQRPADWTRYPNASPFRDPVSHVHDGRWGRRDNHYEDFFDTCSFLFQDPARVGRLRDQFGALRLALTAPESLAGAERVCQDIGTELNGVMARTERLAATPDRDGMLHELDIAVVGEAT